MRRAQALQFVMEVRWLPRGVLIHHGWISTRDVVSFRLTGIKWMSDPWVFAHSMALRGSEPDTSRTESHLARPPR